MMYSKLQFVLFIAFFSSSVFAGCDLRSTVYLIELPAHDAGRELEFRGSYSYNNRTIIKEFEIDMPLKDGGYGENCDENNYRTPLYDRFDVLDLTTCDGLRLQTDGLEKDNGFDDEVLWTIDIEAKCDGEQQIINDCHYGGGVSLHYSCSTH